MRAAAVWAFSVAFAVLAFAGCSSEEGSASKCTHVFWYRPAQAAGRVEVVGDFNRWQRPGVRLEGGAADGWLSAAIELSPGTHRYVFVEDGARVLDRTVGTTAFEAGEEVSLVEVGDCRMPELRVLGVTRTRDRVEAELVLERGAIDPASIETEGLPFTVRDNVVRVAWEHAGKGKRRVRVRAADGRGNVAERLVSLWQTHDGAAFDPRDAIVYQIIVDRYRDENGPLAAPVSIAGRAGGTLRGVTNALESGELDDANVLWLSPLAENPAGAFPGTDGRLYSSYHGYWPIAPRALDPRLGTDDDLRALVASAHARGIRIVLDVVPNHVHEEHPYAKVEGFTQGSGCTCGVGACDWASHIETCRFAPYLPDLDWRSDAVARSVTDDITDWVERFDLDGVRIDAVPMFPRAGTRRIAAALRKRFEHPGAKLWIIGENFTGPGGYASLRYFLGPFGLDTEFHFPLMWALRGAIARGDEPMRAIADAVETGEATWADAGAVMGLMIGNHDVPRFSSVSTGEAEGDGWSPATTSTEAVVYDKQLLALGLVFTLPGAPFVYYGDELALFGRADPDSRRVMPAAKDLSAEMLRVRDGTRKLSGVRACAPALRRGRTRFHFRDRERIVFSRSEDDGSRPVVVVATRDAAGVPGVEVPLEGVTEGAYVDVLSGEAISVRPALTFLPGGPFSLRVFVREDDPCASR